MVKQPQKSCTWAQLFENFDPHDAIFYDKSMNSDHYNVVGKGSHDAFDDE